MIILDSLMMTLILFMSVIFCVEDIKNKKIYNKLVVPICAIGIVLHIIFRRKSEYTEISSTNKKLFELLKNEYPMTYQCVLGIKELIFNKFNWNIGDEELLYLILHVNRLCSHEGVTNESA